MVELLVVTSDDWVLWRAVRLQALAEAPYAFGSTLAAWQDAPEHRWRTRLEVEDSHNLVALADGRPVGMASGVPGDEPHEAGLISMYVAPAARGSGVGEALLDAVSRWALTRGCRTLCLAVRADNVRARKVYERWGFTVAGEAEKTASEPLELRMCKSLQEL